MSTIIKKPAIMNPFPERLRAARKKRGWSLQDLADNMPVSISKQALNKYEAGLMQPSGEVLVALGKALQVKADYFARPLVLDLPPVEFRKAASLPVKQIESIKETVRDVIERYLEVENLLQIDDQFNNPLPAHIIYEPEEVDVLAYKLLKHWKVGIDPIPNVIEMLEEKGIRVIEIPGPESFDGLSTMVGKVAVIVLNRNFSIERKRFTALHELGHLVLTIDEEADKEKVCHAFAGAMLLPGQTLQRMIGDKRNNIAPGELVNIKEQYGISTQAIMMRALILGIINQSTASRFFRSMTGNKKETGLGSFRGNEKSYRFEQLVFRLAAEDIVSMSKAASLAGLKLAEFKDKLDAR